MTNERSIGRVVTVDSLSVYVRLDDDLKSLYKSGYEEIYPVARINSYIIIPVGAERIVAMVNRVMTKEETDLTKSSGASDKSGSHGGSFGIGKFAPYACSSLRTVFYSTSDKDGLCASQGVSRLTSFKNKKNEITQGTGGWPNRFRRELKFGIGLH